MNKEIAVRIISSMPFSAADYARNRELIINEALSKYVQQTGERRTEAQECLTELIDKSFDERKELSICGIDMPDHLRDGSCFSIFLNNTEVKGKVMLSPKDLMVEIISPFQGRVAGSKLEMLAPVIWTECLDKNTEANKEGRHRAITLLADIYYSLLH